MALAPIALFVYNRLDHTKETLDALRKNILAGQSDLIIFSDAPKTEKQVKAVHEVRKYLAKIGGFKSVTIVERPVNLGLANSIIDGVTKVCNDFGKVIVLEDDLVTSSYFLQYMNDALVFYEKEEKVISIHGYLYPVKQNLPETFFIRGADCWGWATWKRGWQFFNPNGQMLLDELVQRRLVNEFDFNGYYKFSDMLKKQIRGLNNSWAIRWYASAFLADKLTLYPGRSLVKNIGNDSSGTHCGTSDAYDVELSCNSVDIVKAPVVVSVEAYLVIANFFKQNQVGLIYRLLRRIKNVVSAYTLKEIKSFF
jgi:hypothetical protein